MGRPKGSFGRKMQVIRAAANNALRPGKSPLDIMIKNMLHYDEAADKLMHEIVHALHFSKKKVDPMELLDKLAKLGGLRMDAQKCAVDAAPFVHSKLATMQLNVTNDEPIERAHDETAMSEDQLVAYYNKLRLRPTDVKPVEIVTLDNETGDEIETVDMEDVE